MPFSARDSGRATSLRRGASWAGRDVWRSTIAPAPGPNDDAQGFALARLCGARCAVLPFSVRTQDDDQNVTLGTVSSAPQGPHMLRAVVRTTIATAIIMGIFYGVTRGLGLTIDDIPNFVPGLK